jgi:hypothetical protein
MLLVMLLLALVLLVLLVLVLVLGAAAHGKSSRGGASTSRNVIWATETAPRWLLRAQHRRKHHRAHRNVKGAFSASYCALGQEEAKVDMEGEEEKAMK